MQIRPFRTADTASVLELANSFAAFDGTTSEADLQVASYFPRGFWVAEDEEKVVGLAFGYLSDVPKEVLERWKSRKAGQIELVAVHPDYRKTGIGRALISKVLQRFKEEGADVVLLNCPAVSIEAKVLYESLGFKVKSYQMWKRL
jgi:ribosomal protein S18 acetylase RimI-like enzyme